MKTKIASELLWRFDRTFGNSKKWFAQLIWVLVILLFAFCICIPIGNWLARLSMNKVSVDGGTNVTWYTIGVILKSNSLDWRAPLPHGWQVFLVFIGTFLFSGITLTFVVNLVRSRLDAYQKGSVRYLFDNHILFLGGSEMILPMIKELYKQESIRKRHFVVLTDEDSPLIRLRIRNALSEEERKILKITVLRGVRDDKESLESVCLSKAGRIYIVGDNPFDSEHDSKSMACWNIAKNLCGQRKNVPCLLMFNRASSSYLFKQRNASVDTCFDTTLVNRLESVAQRVLVHNGNDGNSYPALDRNGIGKDDSHTVHVVLYGLTDVSYAMATVSAQLCHFPNFINNDQSENVSRRTKITLISPDMKVNLSSFIQPLYPLLNLSKCTFINKESSHLGEEIGIGRYREEDFMDVEWEFVDGDIAEQWVRDLLLSYCEKGAYLTVMLCQLEADKNIASALFLPSKFHNILMKNGEIDFERTIPVFVYQPESEEMVKTAREQMPMFANIFSFGSVKESYDPAIRQRIREGKRINYIYHTAGHYDTFPSDDELDRLWHNLSYSKQMSNIYSAMHIGCKLRSVGNKPLTEEDVRILSAVEHCRWNMEKLLAGYEALTREERKVRYARKAKGEFVEDLEMLHKHDCIAPYNELTEIIKAYDEIIVKNMYDIIDKKSKILTKVED